MTCIEIHQYRQLLNTLFNKVKILPDDLELKAHWARYLCIMLSGYIEVSVRTLYGHYARENAHPNIADFAEGQLERFQNPNMDKILDLTRKFNPSWEEALRQASAGELRDAVNSVVAVRHQIAHGQSVGITYVRIRQYYEDVEKVIALIEKQCSD